MQKFYKQLWRLIALALAVFWCLPAIGLAAAKKDAVQPAPVKVTVLATAGINGRIINWDYELTKTTDFGLVQISSLVKKERQANPYTILVDEGNMLSGSALTSYFATQPSKLPNPMIIMYNYLDYDAIVPGDGEFAYGPGYLSKALTAAKFPALAANAYSGSSLWSAVKPYIIKEFEVGKDKKKEKIRIGIIGAATVNPANSPQNYAGIEFKDQKTAIDAAVKHIAGKVDAIIIVTNNGLEINGVMAAAPGKFGSSLSKTELTFEKVGKKWQLKQTATTSLYTVVAPADRAMADVAWPYHDATLQHLQAEKKASNREKGKE
ncbi:Trifunctional nucleotide phosphoesterase protein YfkN [Sporomusa carbonis]|uniref:hypothetical protein n=1 Tax=Sporomusa carbonis TaxID=3076075 RepID=UPI003A7511BC